MKKGFTLIELLAVITVLGIISTLSFVLVDKYIDNVEESAVKESLYTPPANGWVCVSLTKYSGQFGVLLIQGNMANGCTRISGVNTANAMLPVVGGVQVSINSALADGMVYAYFYPCLGNV